MYGKTHSKSARKSISNAMTGKKNVMYGKRGKNHAASQTYRLIGNGFNEIFYCGKDIEEFVVNMNINWNTLRQYSAKGKKYKGYIVERIKR